MIPNVSTLCMRQVTDIMEKTAAVWRRIWWKYVYDPTVEINP